ncbi:MAG TPA: YraN family protein [Nocardioides sp.]|nr:YraN family protein [Nocardioides sp.]
MTDMAVTSQPRGATAASRKALGEYGEEVAARYLHGLGYAVLERNWRCEIGEVDLVCREGSTLVICEVKTRSSTVAGTPHEALTDAKLARLKRLGERWARDRGIRPDGIRIDLVAVLRPRRGPAQVDHVRGLL